MKNKFKKTGLGVLLGLSFLGIGYLVCKPSDSQELKTLKIGAKSSMRTSAPAAKEPLIGPIFFKSDSVDKGAKSATKKAENTRVSESADYDNRIAKEKELYGKVLRSRFEQDELNLSLSELETLKYARSLLHESVAENTRMRAVEFLVHSLRWKDNPRRQEVAMMIADFLNSDLPRPTSSLAQRKSLLADKIELFVNLYQQVPELADRLLKNQNTTEMNSRVFKFAYNLYLKK